MHVLALQAQVQDYYLLFRRAESFRKALAYQKRYLILLLGGFQDCEDVTLALIARIGGTPGLDNGHNGRDHVRSLPLSPLARFRRAALVAVACQRLRTLWQRWSTARQRAHGATTNVPPLVAATARPRFSVNPAEDSGNASGNGADRATASARRTATATSAAAAAATASSESGGANRRLYLQQQVLARVEATLQGPTRLRGDLPRAAVLG